MSRLQDVAVAFAIAPLAPVLVYSVVAHSAAGFLVAAFFSYAFALPLGVPTFLLFQRLGWLRAWQIILMASLLACCVYFPFVGWNMLTYLPLTSFAPGVALFAFFGAITGAVFWFVLKQRANKALHGDGPRPAGSTRA